MASQKNSNTLYLSDNASEKTLVTENMTDERKNSLKAALGFKSKSKKSAPKPALANREPSWEARVMALTYAR
ncbi:hypothetical protein K4F52_000749 [Lecanicillium sp. MT-2017a]|nr:hypothetical protein K4F52_000749 [Lecanicillium sp. MT-2017a]